jgi:hypothetical protein
MFCSGGNCYLLLADLVPVNHSMFEQSLDADDLRFTRCQRLVHYLAGTGLVASEGQGWERDMHEVGRFGNRSNSGGMGLSRSCSYLS